MALLFQGVGKWLVKHLNEKTNPKFSRRCFGFYASSLTFARFFPCRSYTLHEIITGNTRQIFQSFN